MSGRKYAVTPRVRIVNWLVTTLIRLGVDMGPTYLLTVRGRKSGAMHTNPVTLVEGEGRRWLVAPYGEMAWVKNARASGQVMLARHGRTETLAFDEVPVGERAPILKTYLSITHTVQPYFDARPDSPLEAFAAEAGRHPVFLLKPS